MLMQKKQMLTEAVDILEMQNSLPLEFEGAKLYGNAQESENEVSADCKVYQLINETGTGEVTVYQVFTGIELYYNDMHMAYCNQNKPTAKSN